jgi:hypothetical protein
MLEFMAVGHWLAFVPVPVVAECRSIGLMISASSRDLIDHPHSRKVHDRPNGAPEVAIVPTFPEFRGAHDVDLVRPKALPAITRRLFPPVAIRSSFSLA